MRLLEPLRAPATWAGQRGFLPSSVKAFLPWSWVFSPFTIYGDGWQCRWLPTGFDLVGQRIFWSGLREWEKETSPVMLEKLRSSSCFIDVGANCGIYTILGCAVNPRVRVIALEPVPKIYAALTGNVAHNQFGARVTTLNMALGEKDGVVSFHEAENSTMGSLAVEGYRGQQGQVIQVVCRTLDSIVEEMNLAPDFIKIDVEGFEHQVLKGGERTLSKFRPQIVLEANPGDPVAEIAAILSRHRYQLQHITENGPQARSEIIPDETYRNWLCVPGV